MILHRTCYRTEEMVLVQESAEPVDSSGRNSSAKLSHDVRTPVASPSGSSRTYGRKQPSRLSQYFLSILLPFFVGGCTTGTTGPSGIDYYSGPDREPTAYIKREDMSYYRRMEYEQQETREMEFIFDFINRLFGE